MNFIKRIARKIKRTAGKIKKAFFSVTRVIVFQPGKVGSSTVQASLERAFKNRNHILEIHHVHALNNLDEREEFIKRTRKDPSESLVLIQEWRELRREIADHPQQRWHIINLVRDPIAIKVSALFQLLDQHIPDWQERQKGGRLTMSELEALFFSKQEFGFAGLEQWYNKQIKDIWGLDVFAEPFPRHAGYKIYEKANIRLIIIRLEDLNQVAKQAFNDFLGLENFQVVNANVSEEKPYAELYNEFKKRPLPEQYVEQGLGTRFAIHFYSPEEIETFRKRWTQT